MAADLAAHFSDADLYSPRAGRWFFRPWELGIGENPREAAARLTLPASTGEYNPAGEPYLWLSNQFTYSPGADPLYLELGTIEAAVRIYLNGSFIGEGGRFPPQAYFSGGRYYRFLLPEAELIGSGLNRIRIQLYNDRGERRRAGCQSATDSFGR